MRDLWLLLALTTAMAWFVQNTTFHPERLERINQEHLPIVLIIFLLLAGFVGLRLRLNDTGTYRHAYENMAKSESFWTDFDPDLGATPGFFAVNYWLRTHGVTTQSFLMLYSLVTNGLYVYFLRKYSNNFPVSIFLFFVTGAYTFTAAAIKQCIATSICVASLGLALQKKWLPYVLFVLLASTFHPYALMYLAVPLFTFKPWTRWTYFYLFGFVGLGFALESLLGTVVNITAMIGEEYDLSSFTGDGVNIFRVLVCNVPTLLTFVFRKQLFKNSKPADHLMVNLCMLNGAIMFVGLFGTANYFARLANYFLMAQTIALPWILKKLHSQTRRFLTLAMIVCYLAYFYYANVINQNFDALFSRLTLYEYLTKYMIG